MNRSRLVFYVLVVLALAGPLLPAFGADALWEDAVELYERYGDLIPGRMRISFVQYNGRGDLVSSDESELRLSLDQDGEIQSSVVYAISNGEDVTEERRENPQAGGGPFGGGPGGGGGQGGGNAFAGLQLSPFDPDQQENVRIVGSGTPVLMDGITAQPIEFVQSTGRRSRNLGTAWLSTETGEPLALEVRIEPLPILVQEFVMRQEFARDEEGRWIMSRMEFEGEGTILFVRRRLESDLEFSQYFRSE